MYYFDRAININNETNFTVELTKVDEINKVISGTFYGRLSDNDGNYLDIEKGEFTVHY